MKAEGRKNRSDKGVETIGKYKSKSLSQGLSMYGEFPTKMFGGNRDTQKRFEKRPIFGNLLQ